MADNSSACKELPNPWTGDEYECGFPVTLVAELDMRAASNAIREKPLWYEKFKDPIIAARWKKELLEANYNPGTNAVTGEDDADENGHEGEVDGGRNHLTEDQVRFIFQELEWYADQRQQQIDQAKQKIRTNDDDNDEIIAPIERAIDGTRRADGLIPERLKQELLTCVQKLADVPDHLKDWHPGSKNQVLDLVHPSLFPAIVGRTRILKDEETIPALDYVGKGQLLDSFDDWVDQRGVLNDSGEDESKYYSETYQWLPTDFLIHENDRVEFLSYINNLHPLEHKDMYPVLEEILEYFIPMFEQVLAEMRDIHERPQRLTVDPCHEWYELPQEFNIPWEQRDEASYLAEDAWRQVRIPKPVKVPDTFVPPPELEPFKLKSTGTDSNRKEPLQVIVKLANIELSPENPTYEGGTWHVEGMANENIVATGIYYYHSENISETRLNFRIQVQEPMYEQNDDRGVKIMYGLENEGALIQHLDGIVTKQDRCIVFPNIYQHQVQPFELIDKNRPGKRQILVFFLINPQEPILSTTHVPPQQLDWALGAGYLNQIAKRLPIELIDEVKDLLDWPMTLEEAKEHRKKLMKERKFFVKDMNETVFERPFSLCEH
ncbi:hypothetical protein BGZ83_009071 [Gryganskiella cystojenkinii]|nr:hypothetical protein BGZ83_009071 [Gryganskiella cystojenkinii]